MTEIQLPNSCELAQINEALDIVADDVRHPLSFASDSLLNAIPTATWNRTDDGSLAWNAIEARAQEDLGLQVLARLERLRRDFETIAEAHGSHTEVSMGEALDILLDSFYGSSLGEQHAADVSVAESLLAEETRHRMRAVVAAEARFKMAPEFTEALLRLLANRKFITSHEIAILSRKPHEEVLSDILAMKTSLGPDAYCEECVGELADGETGRWVVTDTTTALGLLGDFGYFPELSAAIWDGIFDHHAGPKTAMAKEGTVFAAEAVEHV